MKRLVIIDGSNFFYRSFTHTHTYTSGGGHLPHLQAFIRNLCALIRELDINAETRYAVCRDMGHQERTRISQEAVAKGIIPKAYKQERLEARVNLEPLEQRIRDEFYEQLQLAMEMLAYTRIPAIGIPGEEADDIAGSLTKKYTNLFNEVILVSTDKDWIQLLENNIKIFNPMLKQYTTWDDIKQKYNLTNTEQWIEAGALAGESGPSSDTIYGVPSIGVITGCALIAKHGSLNALLQASQNIHHDLIQKIGWEAFKSGVRSGEIKPKEGLKEAKVLAYQDVLEVALKLKRIRNFLPATLPEETCIDWRSLDEFLLQNHITIPLNNFELLLKR